MLNWRKGSLLNTTDRKLMELTSRWYQTIPQNIGMRPDWRALCLNEWMKHQEALDLLDLLGDVKGVQTSFKRGTTTHDRIKAMGATLEVLDRAHPDYRKVERMSTTISPHHRNRFGRARVSGIFKVVVKGQGDNWFDPNNVGNHDWMFHGSRNANMLGITSRGLLMRPPGVVITGSMFGAALYFSPGDCASKSMQYAAGGWGGTRNRKNNFYLFIVNVAQGRVMKYYQAQTSLTRPPRGYDSVRGCKGQSLINDEHMIYDPRQHRMEYIVDIDPGR